MKGPHWLRRVSFGVLLGCAIFLAVPGVASIGGHVAVEQVSQASYYDFMNTYLYTHTGNNRGPTGTHLPLCRDNIAALMQSYGLSVTQEQVRYNNRWYQNVVGTKIGTVHPEREYIISGHYDSVSNPGADDDASGVAAVLEAARILSQYDSECTIRFVGFTMEETGLIGSGAYVDLHWADDIRGMISVDMIAYNPGGDACNIYGRVASDPIKGALAAAVMEYSGGLEYTIHGDTPASDHAPFEAAGFQACFFGEAGENPYYHTQQDSIDRPNYLDFVYATQMTRCVVGWLVDNAGVLVDHLNFAYPDGRPTYTDPVLGGTLRVEIVPVGGAVLQAGTATFHYDLGAGWQTAAMSEVAANVFEASLPAAPCGTLIRYYFTAADTTGAVYADPYRAASVPYNATAAYGETVYFADDFESDQGWTVNNTSLTGGAWQRGIPAGDGSRGDPTVDYDGSGACYLTGNALGDSDVDGGPTRLLSPLLDLSSGGDFQVSYACWFANDDNDLDRLDVAVSNDDGVIWVPVESVGITAGWEYHTFSVGDHVPPTTKVRVRFSVTDNPNNSITEAALDAFEVRGADCQRLLGDMNCDGVVGFADINPFVTAMLDPAAYTTVYAGCDLLNGDFSGNGLLGFEDINGFVAALTSP